ncbi:threonine/serine transporter TdcC [Salmonella enterica]|nr:threonine/serine transporter TdcC [Salmonella enterica]
MSTTDSIVSSQAKQSSWRKSDTTWTLGLFGTAIGAGVLFFPIRAGFGGLIPILLMLVLAYPIAFYCHRALARLCLSGSNPSGNITETVEEHFGKTGGVVITFLYFFAICPLLWIYGVTITNTFMTFWENQLQMPALNRGFVALFLLLLMAFVIWFGKDLMVKVMSYLVWPFIASLVLISLSLIPYWNSAVIDQVDLSNIALTGHDGILVTVWLGISIMVFSFNFSPIVSSFVVSKREEYEKEFGREFTERKCSQIISRASMLMVAVVMFFAFSCLFTLSPQNMADAKAQNIAYWLRCGWGCILVTVWLGISIMVFSFNFSPIVSSFVVSKREEYEKEFGREFTERKCSQIISRASMLMVAVVMFFAFSCLFTLSPQNMADAKAQNIPVLSYLANHFASLSGTKSTFATVLEYGASIIALVAIFKSFFGHYLGTLEGLNGLVLKFGYKGDKTKVSMGKLNTISMIFIMGSTWVVAYANPNILDLIEAMGAPIIASLLCLLPMYAIRKAPSLAKYRGRLDNVFVTLIGLLTILNIVYKLF